MRLALTIFFKAARPRVDIKIRAKNALINAASSITAICRVINSPACIIARALCKYRDSRVSDPRCEQVRGGGTSRAYGPTGSGVAARFARGLFRELAHLALRSRFLCTTSAFSLGLHARAVSKDSLPPRTRSNGRPRVPLVEQSRQQLCARRER